MIVTKKHKQFDSKRKIRGTQKQGKLNLPKDRITNNTIRQGAYD